MKKTREASQGANDQIKSAIKNQGSDWHERVNGPKPREYKGLGNTGIDRKYTGKMPKRAKLKMGDLPKGRRR